MWAHAQAAPNGIAASAAVNSQPSTEQLRRLPRRALCPHSERVGQNLIAANARPQHADLVRSQTNFSQESRCPPRACSCRGRDIADVADPSISGFHSGRRCDRDELEKLGGLRRAGSLGHRSRCHEQCRGRTSVWSERPRHCLDRRCGADGPTEGARGRALCARKRKGSREALFC